MAKSGLRGGTVVGVALVLALAVSGCKSSTTASQPAPIVDMNNGADPAAANMAPVSGSAPVYSSPGTSGSTSRKPSSAVLGQQQYAPNQANGEQYPEQGQYAPQTPYPDQYAQQEQPGQPYDPAYDQYQNDVDAGQQALYAEQPPPPLPVYEQPELTQAGDQWTPGYWDYGPQGYYWVPGAWVAPPYLGALWTPGYWGYVGTRYHFHFGYWGRHIGFYGGVPYGFGYTGRGYEGGYWNGGNFYYNQSVNRLNVRDVHNVYFRNVTVVNNTRASYNGPGGLSARPTAAEAAVYHEQRLPPMQVQRQVAQAAARNRQQFFAENHGHPAVTVAPQRVEADRALPRAIEPVQRGGFGQPAGVAGNPAQVRAQERMQQQNETRQQQGRQAAQNAAQDAAVQHQQAQQQQTLQQQTRQQQAVQAQQLREQQNVQAQQQKNVQAQQLRQQQGVQAQQLRDQQNAQAQQRNAAVQQQRNAAVQQQRNAAVQQQRNADVQQQRNAQEQQQRNAQEQQRISQQPGVRPQGQPVRPTTQVQPVRPAPQAEPARPAPARTAPAAHPAPAAPAGHPAPAAHPAPAPAHGDEHPRG